ncbi:flavin monoamine oxidase family protein [Marinibactrum halimedae]|uniref:Tryptophan 2-monooxygenase n=1 Tax=Marinibactrum halimedae TaxID=1444977 RepID=A0AA37WNN3_9GAMM|nr:FAD-dependent oxidoreductase [Marinibactrum halimedae]MCD9457878.1 FAD-dependent oxidoreductase [Marinibactrum halimedae]GLS26301.1 flavin monoamine oxidase [Marinibactrum halimedae]
MNQSISRRSLLTVLGAVGGASAVYEAAGALGMVTPVLPPQSLMLQPANPNKNTVAILGAGISGLMVAYELERAGYQCVILEASHRAGGRNLTLRHNDLVDELGHRRRCQFSPDSKMYFNAGPARIPGHHQRVLHYCKAFQIPLQIRANSSRLAYVHDEVSSNSKKSRKVRIGEYIADARGLLSELAWKSADRVSLDEPFTEEELESLSGFIRMYGDLTEKGNYQGSDRAGSTKDRMLFHSAPKAPLSTQDLLSSHFWHYQLHATEIYDWGAPLMEIVGGMDGLVKAFMKRIHSPIILNAMVQDIRLRENGTDIVYQDQNKQSTLKVDYCFNSIPAHLITGLRNNFPRDYRQALGTLKRGHLFKIGLEMKERFWEREGIYGGITYTSSDVGQLWYPSHDIHSQKGVMLGAYVWGEEKCAKFERLSPQARLQRAKECGNAIHDNYAQYIEAGESVPWARMNHMMGCGSQMSPEDRKRYFDRIQQPEGHHFLIGDQVSYHSGWQEGAMASAEHALLSFDRQFGRREHS